MNKGIFSAKGTPSQVLAYLEALQAIYSYESIHNMPVQLTSKMLVRMPLYAVIQRAQIISRKWNTN